MIPLLPPSSADLKRNLALLAEDWTRGSWLMRYFVASQLGSGALSLLCSGACFVALAQGRLETYLWLLTAAGICLVHSLASWSVLKRRFAVRYALW